MMTLKFRIVCVDMDGYCGRDLHPDKSDEGLVVAPVKMEATVWLDDEHYKLDTEATADEHCRAAFGPGEASHEMMWTCVTTDGRLLQLMGHELELV